MQKCFIITACLFCFILGDSRTALAGAPASGWKVSAKPVFSGQYGCASDPTVLRHEGRYRMYYTGLHPQTGRTVLCLAESADGRTWSEVRTDALVKGLVLNGRDGEWDENLESAFVVKVGKEFRLYYSGYRDEGDPAKGFPAALGIAVSTDGVRFKRIGKGPALSPVKNSFDAEALYSPVVVKTESGYAMVYCGHAYSGKVPGVRLLGATSDDGVSWKRRVEPVLEGAAVGRWAKDGVAEPALVETEDGWRLFFTGLEDEERVVGLAKGSSPFGPWEVVKEPIVRPEKGTFADRQVLAPTVLLEKGVARMWLLGTRVGSEEITIGVAERAGGLAK
ncbi:MAG: hypothetical protein ACRDD1_14340 [Planctomycetia bacterium]